MKASRLLLCLFVLVCSASLVPAQSLSVVYENDFQAPVGPEWSRNDRELTPNLYTTFLGRFSGEPVYLDLWDLPDHCQVTVTFELFIIDSWEGSVGYYAGPDIWDLNASTPSDCCGEVNLLHTTFANCECRYQAFPNTYPDVHHPGMTGADRVDFLGYEDDSVYYLSYTFFHDGEDLRLSFAGSSQLQGWLDEAWGIDNIVVEMDTGTRNCCRATRSLPIAYGGGVEVPVAIEVNPNPRSEVHLVEEMPPNGWFISHINDGGVLEQSTGLIKWGPFFDDVGRTLTYMAKPFANETDDRFFDGTMYVDGESEAICGDDMMGAGSYHPADLDTDWLIEPTEFTSYGAAWKNLDGWSMGPVPIPADYVTIAGLIWKDGEAYHFDASVSPPWVSDNGKTIGGGVVTSDLGGMTYRPGQAMNVSLEVTPDAGTTAYLVDETLPVGWAVGEISNGGRWHAESRTIKWGPFFDGRQVTLSYSATPSAASDEVATFLGTASFDGANVLVGGERAIPPASQGPVQEQAYVD